jgi:hypothetical protein
MRSNNLLIAGLVLTILGLLGIMSKLTSQISSYVVLGLGLVLLMSSYLIKTKKKKM